MLYKLLYSEELMPYQNRDLIKKFMQTNSRNYTSVSDVEDNNSPSNSANESQQQQMTAKNLTEKKTKLLKYANTQFTRLERGGKQQLLPALSHPYQQLSKPGSTSFHSNTSSKKSSDPNRVSSASM